VVVAYKGAIREGLKENHDKSPSEQEVSRPKMEPATFWIRSWTANY